MELTLEIDTNSTWTWVALGCTYCVIAYTVGLLVVRREFKIDVQKSHDQNASWLRNGDNYSGYLAAAVLSPIWLPPVIILGIPLYLINRIMLLAGAFTKSCILAGQKEPLWKD